jgi:molybdate transport system substrate-binding protein
MKKLRSALFVLPFLLFAAFASAGTITVSAAISLKDALTGIAREYESQTGDHVEFNFKSSGDLAAQIQNGAPVDLFISAANKQVDDLNTAGMVDIASRKVIVGNQLVLIVPADAKNGPKSFDDLKDSSVTKIAIGEPKTVPAGAYAMQTLMALKLADALKPRLIYGINVRQVLDYVERGEVAAGLVYATDAKEAGDKVKIVAAAAENTHEPIIYPAVIVKASKQKDTAGKFLEFLGTDKVQAEFIAQGFSPASAAVPTTLPSK